MEGEAGSRVLSVCGTNRPEMTNLPVEMLTEVINFACSDVGTAAVIPFVCHLWKEVAKPWAYEYDEDLNRKVGMTCYQSPSVSLRTRKEKLSGARYSVAALRGHLGLLKWFKKMGSPLDLLRASALAAENGRLAVLKWLREKEGGKLGSKESIFNEVTCYSAAERGHLEIVKWLREVASCPWDRWTFLLAAKRGQIEVLKWVKENGSYPARSSLCIGSRRGPFGDPEVVEKGAVYMG